jgi:protein-S-isoprenylcysteine O-methyltransferase Ste14
MNRILALAFGVVCYGVFFVSFLYLVGFLGKFVVPKHIDSGEPGPPAVALAVNVLLMALFGAQHSVMARRGFKAWWTRYIPRPVERSVYVLLTAVCLILIYWLWQPMLGTVWSIENPTGRLAVQGLFLAGFGLVLVTTFLIDHFDLFGLRQVYLHARGQEYTAKSFKNPGPYKLIRHPLYVGWFITFWATPDMTVGHLLFAVGMSGYILLAIPHEERDLIHFLGDEYRRYREKTPMLLPIPRRK